MNNNTIHGKRSIFICPNCRKRIVFMPGNSDIEHECNSGNKVVDQEDVLVVGDWEDYSGSGKANLPNYQGIENKLQVTDAGIRGADVDPVTKRGNKASTHRQRQHIEFIKTE